MFYFLIYSISAVISGFVTFIGKTGKSNIKKSGELRSDSLFRVDHAELTVSLKIDRTNA